LDVDLGGGGDFPSQIVELKGSTIVKFTIPYLFETSYRKTVSNPASTGWTFSPKITIELLTLPVTGQGAAPYITAVVFRAAAEDFQVSSPQRQQIDPTVFGQTSLQKEFKFKFDPISCKCELALEGGFATMETTGKITDVMKRFTPANGVAILQTLPVESFANASGFLQVGPGSDALNETFQSPYYMYMQLFRYQRGSMRWRILKTDTATAPPAYFSQTTNGPTFDVYSGFDVWIPNHNPVHTVEMPWYGTIPYYPTTSAAIESTTMRTNSVIDNAITGTNSTFIAFGDDRVHSYLMPPAKIIYVSAASSLRKTTPKPSGATLKTVSS